MANMGYDDGLPSQTPHAGMSERVHSPWGGDYDLPASVDAVSVFQDKCWYLFVFFVNACSQLSLGDF